MSSHFNRSFETIKRQSVTQPMVSLSKAEIQLWRRFIESEIGFVLPTEQLGWLVHAVEATARSNQLSIEALWQRMTMDPLLRQTLLDEVLILESRFFRHPPSLDFIVNLAKASTSNRHQSHHKPFRIWSLGCANGQEVWSLAMMLASKGIDQYHILGSDVSQKALTQAKSAQYEGRTRRFIPNAYQQFLIPMISMPSVSRQNQTNDTLTDLTWQVSFKLQDHVSFIWHNIFCDDLPTGDQDVIICQNVLIYFRKFDQRDILTKLTQACAIGGHIILAPSEGLSWRPKNMRKVKHPLINAWQKISDES